MEGELRYNCIGGILVGIICMEPKGGGVSADAVWASSHFKFEFYGFAEARRALRVRRDEFVTSPALCVSSVRVRERGVAEALPGGQALAYT